MNENIATNNISNLPSNVVSVVSVVIVDIVDLDTEDFRVDFWGEKLLVWDIDDILVVTINAICYNADGVWSP